MAGEVEHQSLCHARALYLQCCHKVELTWEHVKAHVGVPWNELADVIAKVAATADLGFDVSLPQTFVTSSVRELEWSFLIGAPADVMEQ